MEKVYQFNQSDQKLIEKILDNDEVMINHMVLNQDDIIPQHDSNSNVYMIIVKGRLTLQLSNNPVKYYEQGSIVNIPYNTKMNISNTDSKQLEFFVVKAPSPRLYKQQ